MNIGTKIKKIRYSNNISQSEMADILGINRNYLSRIETNKSVPSAEILTKIANKFSISVDTLLGISNSSDRDIKINKINSKIVKMDNEKLDFIIHMIDYMSNN